MGVESEYIVRGRETELAHNTKISITKRLYTCNVLMEHFLYKRGTDASNLSLFMSSDID